MGATSVRGDNGTLLAGEPSAPGSNGPRQGRIEDEVKWTGERRQLDDLRQEKLAVSIRVLMSKKALALLLVMALLVCHGAYGTAVHQLVSEAALSMGGHTYHGAVPAEEEGASNEGLGGLGYAAALLLVLTAVFWLRFGGALERRGVPTFRPLRGRYPLAAVLYPQGPTIPLLQVFRL